MHSLQGKNIIGCAHTGSGKTACFALPVLQKLAKDPYGIFALVITPTRELAYQINEQFKTFSGQNLNLRTSVITGGVNMMLQASELNDIPHVIVGTPGRLVHQLKHDQFSFKEYLSNLQFLVLDEADRMLTDPTIQEDLTYILNAIKEVQETRRQTFLYSATMARNFESLFSKELVFGKFLNDDKSDNFDIVEVGNNETADS